MGEGGGALVLEEYEHAIARGAKIYCELAGAGATADAHHITAPHPEGDGAVNVMKFALEDAELKPQDVDYVNVHGTSTPLGDIAETKAILKLFGEQAYKLILALQNRWLQFTWCKLGFEVIATIFLCKTIYSPPINLFYRISKLIQN
jgi:3-oxoacyl-[acyl-carrier-protein] synthase II